MLILTRCINKSIIIGDGRIKITVLGINGCQVKIGIDAPKDIAVHREEVFNKINGEFYGNK